MDKKRYRVLRNFIVFLFIIISINNVSSLTNISTCSNLNISGEYYNIINDISSSSTCINITADNIILNGNSYYVNYGSGSNNSYGIYAKDRQNITLINLFINESSVSGNNRNGIYLYNTTNSILNNSNIRTYNVNSSGILLNSSNNNLVISNIILTSGTRGYDIYLLSSSNNTVMSNNVTSTGASGYGVYSFSSSNNTLISNNVTLTGSNGYGIYSYSSTNQNITLNKVKTSSAGSIGIYLSTASNNNRVSYNSLNVLSGNRFFFDGSSLNNNLTGNVILNRNKAFYDLSVNAGTNNLWLIDQIELIENYTFSGTGSLISFKNTTFGEIRFNTGNGINGIGNNLSSDIRIKDNFAFADILANSGLNKVANITLYNIGNRGFSNASIFKDGLACPSNVCTNYTSLTAINVIFKVVNWSNYTIGDTGIDLVNPNATLLQPVDNLYSNITTQNFTVSATDNVGLSNITLFVYNGSVLVSQQTQSVSGTSGIFGIVYNFLTNGIFKWFYQIVDSANNLFTTQNRTIIIDTVYPQLSIGYPENLANYDYVVSNITHIVNETNLANCTFSDGIVTNLITCNAIYYFNATENTNNWYITATDLAGQSYVKPVTFIVDTIYPQISFSNGTQANNSITNSPNLLVNVSINESNFYKITYVVANLTDIINSISFFTPITSVIFTNHTEGVYYFNVTVEDIIGRNVSTETRTYTVDQTPPSIIINTPISANYTNNTLFVNLTSDGSQIFFTDGVGLTEYFSPVYEDYPEGEFNFTAFAYDLAGNVNQANVTFFVDSLLPSISFVSPTELNNIVKSINQIRVNVTVVEASLGNITIRLFNSTSNEIASSTNPTSPYFVNFVNLTNGVYRFNATACDLYNNCVNSATRKVTIDQSLGALLDLTLIVNQYPYVDFNVTYPIRVLLTTQNITVTDAVTTMILTQVNGTNLSINLPFNSTSSYYQTALIFDEVGNYPFTINANSSSFGFVSHSGTFYVRSPYYVNVRLIDLDTLDNIINDYAFVTAEYVGNLIVPDIEIFVHPLINSNLYEDTFHAPYINGEATLKLYEPQRDYVFRYYSGDIQFSGEYSQPNITQSYGDNVFLGQRTLNGTNTLLQFVLSEKEQHPYRWLANWTLIILLILVGVGSVMLFFAIPDKPQIALIFGFLFTFILIAIRFGLWLWGVI